MTQSHGQLMRSYMDILNEEDTEELQEKIFENNAKKLASFLERVYDICNHIFIDTTGFKPETIQKHLSRNIDTVIETLKKYLINDNGKIVGPSVDEITGKSSKYMIDFFPSFITLCRAFMLYGEFRAAYLREKVPKNQAALENEWREILMDARGTIYEDEIHILHEYMGKPLPNGSLKGIFEKFWEVIIKKGLTTRKYIGKDWL